MDNSKSREMLGLNGFCEPCQLTLSSTTVMNGYHFKKRMWNEPSLEELIRLPGLYTTDQTPLPEKIIEMHFFIGGCDWFAAEYSFQDRIFFGYAILNDDLLNAEWGYFSFDELREVRIRGFEIDRDLHWRRQEVKAVERIVQAYRAQGLPLE